MRDLFTEFRDRTNGLPTPAGAGLLGALVYFGLDAKGATEKKDMQEAIGNFPIIELKDEREENVQFECSGAPVCVVRNVLAIG